MSLRETKVFKKLFPLQQGDYIRFKKHINGVPTYWRYGTIYKISENRNSFFIKLLGKNMTIVFMGRGDEIEKAHRKSTR